MCSPRKGFLLIVSLKATRQVKIAVLTPQCAAHRVDNFVIEYQVEIETEIENPLLLMPVYQPDGFES